MLKTIERTIGTKIWDYLIYIIEWLKPLDLRL
jgi:hypothetical protein